MDIGTVDSPKGKFSGKNIPLLPSLLEPCARGLFYSLLRNSRPRTVLTPPIDCGLFSEGLVLVFLRCLETPEILSSLRFCFSYEPGLLLREIGLPQLCARLLAELNLNSFLVLVVSSIASIAETQVSSSLESLDFCFQRGIKLSS